MRQFGVPGVRAGGRVHGHVQDHDLAGAMGLAGEFGGVRRVGHDRRGHRAGQGQHAAIPGQVLPQVVDDQRQVGFGGWLALREQTRQTAQQDEEKRNDILNGRT
jgi:hypothetical protein